MPDLQLLTHVRYFAAKAGVAAVMLFPIASSAQPRVRLDPPVTVSEPRFSAVTGAVLLPDGRVIVSDPIEQAVVLVERRGTSRVLGRIGSGPGEYRQPQKLLALRNKGALLIDPELRRLTLIDVTARFAPAVPFPSGLAAFALAGSQSVSDSGIMHFSAPLIGARPREEPVFRWRWPHGTLLPVDTILGEKLVQAGAGAARIVPLSHADAVATLTDGTRVTMRASERVVEWVPPKGRPVRRPFPGGVQDIPQAVLDKVQPLELRREVDRQYPPFNPHHVLVSSGDRVWLQALPTRGDSATWLGFTMSDSLPVQLVLDRSSRLIAVQEPFAIIVRRMDDDSQRIEVRRMR